MNFKTLVTILAVSCVPVTASAMSESEAQSLAASTSKAISACAGGGCVSKALTNAKSKMRGMPVLSKSSSAISKITKAIKKSCSGSCDSAAISKVQNEVAKQASKLGKSRSPQDKAFASALNANAISKALK